jgi:ribonuclease H2 subunit A
MNLFPNIRFTVCTKADALYPVVGAASVMAKVTRDYELAMWPHRNPEVPLKGPLGSGYPSDPVTSAWLNANVDKIHVFHRTLVRYSWSSAQRVLAKHSSKGVWYPTILPTL